MKLFGFFKDKNEANFQITEPDKNWVEDNFKWLIQVYGYPSRQGKPICLNDKSFPKTFKDPTIKIQNIVDDLSCILYLDSNKITYELQEDLRDSYGTPYEIEGKPFESETVIAENAYKIFLAQSLLQNPKRLLYNLIYEFIKIRLSESKLDYDTGEDTSLFIYLAGVYFGFGTILSQNLEDRGVSNDGFWETKWNYVSEMPNEVMAFALALFSKLIEQDNPDWKNQLPRSLKQQIEKATNYLNENPSSLYSKGELDANDLLNQAEGEYQKNDFDAAISTSQKVLFLTNDELLKSEIYNNIGYCQTRKGEFEKSIISFKQALEIMPDYGFAYDNLGFSLIKIGYLEEGKRMIDCAIETQNNDRAYSFRNLALYYQALGENEMSEKNFILAFQNMTEPVDLLEFCYGEYLIDNGRISEGKEYLQKAVEKGEPEAIKRMEEIKIN